MLWVGEEGRDIRDGWGLAVDDKKLLGPHWKGFEDYVKPKSSLRFSRFYLRALKQDSHESVDAFMTRARLIANECEYTDTKEHLLNTLNAGLHSDDVRRKLIAKDKTTTLDQALAIVRPSEGTERQLDAIQGTRQV